MNSTHLHRVVYHNCKYSTLNKETVERLFNIITSNITILTRFVKYQELDKEQINKVLNCELCRRDRNKYIILNLMASHQKLDSEFIEKYISYFESNNFRTIIRSQDLDNSIVVRIINTENVEDILLHQILEERTIIDNLDIISKDLLCEHQPLSELFIDKLLQSNCRWLDFYLIGSARLYSTEFLMKYINVEMEFDYNECEFKYNKQLLSIEKIVKFQNLDNTLISFILSSLDNIVKLCRDTKSIDKLVEDISWRQQLDSHTIKQFIHLWSNNNSAVEELLIYQNLSEDLIILMSEMDIISSAGWNYLSRNQKISSSVFRKCRNKIYRCHNSVNELANYNKARVVSMKKAKLDNNIISKIFEFM